MTESVSEAVINMELFFADDGVHTCLIYCTAEQVRFVQYHGVAVDGTRCGEAGKDVCIEGKCVVRFCMRCILVTDVIRMKIWWGQTYIVP